MVILACVFGATWFVATAMAAHVGGSGSTPALAILAASLVGPAQAVVRMVEFGLVLDRGGPLAALLLSGCLTGLSFLALSLLKVSATG